MVKNDTGLRRSKRIKSIASAGTAIVRARSSAAVAAKVTRKARSKRAATNSGRYKHVENDPTEEPVEQPAIIKTKANHKGKAKEKDKAEEKESDSVSNDEESKGTVEATFKAAANRHILLMWLKYWIYDSPHPSSFYRSLPSVIPSFKNIPPPPRPKKLQYSSSKVIELLITSEIGEGACGTTHGGVLCLDGKGSLNCKVVNVACKIAIREDQMYMLEQEYKIYMHLAKNKVSLGIPKVFGYFADTEEGADILVMQHAGHPLKRRTTRVDDTQREQLFNTLITMHDAGVLHGDLNPRNLLIDAEGQATVIDFSHAEISDNEKRMEYEIRKLGRVLDGHNVWVEEQEANKTAAEG